MRRTLMLSASLAVLVPSVVAAQTVRWNDRPSETWTAQAPRVLIAIEGSRAPVYGAPMRVRYEVSDNAYVAVVRVDGEGRMTILFPYSRNQRATARAGLVHYVRDPQLGGQFAFVATDRYAGYVFAIASYAPLDLSAFEYRDYERIGGWSTFTAANREIASRPDVFIERFASAVLWDKDTPYDFDVDYYFPQGYPSTLNTASLCSSLYYGTSSAYLGYPLWSESDWQVAGYPGQSPCGGWYNSVRCFSPFASIYGYGNCAVGSFIAAAQPAGPLTEHPVDPTAAVPNEGVVRGGLFTPTPAPVIPAPGDGPTGTLPTGRFDQVRTADGSDLDGIMSIPARATRKMKEENARREASASTTATSLDRPAATTGKTEKTRTADATRESAPARLEPPPREPTKSKATGEPRRETSKTGYGSPGRTSNTRPSDGPDRVTRPTMDNRPSAGGTVASPNPPSIQGTSTTEKKKPPTN